MFIFAILVYSSAKLDVLLMNVLNIVDFGRTFAAASVKVCCLSLSAGPLENI